MELKLEPVACQVVVQEVLTTLRPLAEAKGLHLEADTPAEEFSILTDSRALRQILLNLTNNAIKFTERGRVRLVVRRQGSDGSAVTEMRVEDTGMGIRPEDQARLFQAFEQLQSSGRTHQQGTGLGLHLSQKLAGLLGGRIRFASEFGRGTTFTLELAGA